MTQNGEEARSKPTFSLLCALIICQYLPLVKSGKWKGKSTEQVGEGRRVDLNEQIKIT